MSIPLDTLLLFAVASLALAVTPGPDMLTILSRSITQGRAAGFATLAGVTTGCLVHITAAALGVSSVFLAVPVAYDALRYAGAAYLLYLAWGMVKPGARAALPVGGGGARVVGPNRAESWRLARHGFMTNALNPKVALFYVALFPQFVDPGHGSLFGQSLALGVMQDVIGAVVNTGVILVAGSLGAWLARRPAWARAQNLALGGVFAGLALRLALADRR